MLSARTKDDTTLQAITRLKGVAKTPSQVYALGPRRLERILYGIGFYRVKTRNLIGICRMLRGRQVPDSLEGLLALPGVGRKTANIVLARAYGRPALGVDVHVHRISNRLGLVRTKKPEQTEAALISMIRKRDLRTLNRDFVAFGQTVCLPRAPKCPECPIQRLCWKVGVKG
jgi:endonuclease-3